MPAFIPSVLLSNTLWTAISLQSTFPEKDRVIGSNSSWTKTTHLKKDAIWSMRIVLKQSNLEDVMEHLMEVSHPDSSNYGNLWSQDEVIPHFAPSQESIDTLLEWLDSAGPARHRIVHTNHKGQLAFDATVAEAERLIRAKNYEFEHSSKSKRGIAADGYHIPERLTGHIEYITLNVRPSATMKRPLPQSIPADALSRRIIPDSGTQVTKSLAQCHEIVTLACAEALYNICMPDAIRKPYPNNLLGVYEARDVYHQIDSNKIFSAYAPSVGFEIPNGMYPVLNSIDGGIAPWNSSFNVTLYKSLLAANISRPLIQAFCHSESEWISRLHTLLSILKRLLCIKYWTPSKARPSKAVATKMY